MNGRMSPVRPCASCTVATPISPSAFTTSASARLMFLTIVGFIASFAEAGLKTGGYAPLRRKPGAGSLQSLCNSRVHLAGVAFENLRPVRVADRRGIHVALGVVVIVSRL